MAAEIEGSLKPVKSKGRVAVFGANATAQVCALVRFVILARVLGPEELGLAAILTLVWSFFAAITESGIDRYIIQNDRGDDPALQGMVHVMYVARGVLSGIGIAVAAAPLAQFYEEPTLFVSMLLLAAAPVIQGFAHSDLKRLQRNGNFAIEARAVTIAESFGLIVVVIAAFFLQTHMAAVFAFLFRASSFFICSRLSAERKYKLAWSLPHFAPLLKWSLPIFLSTTLTFLAQQSDRALLSVVLDLKQVGVYSAIMLMVYMPASTIAYTMTTIQSPRMSDPDLSTRTASRRRLGGECVALASLFTIGYAVCGPIAVPIVFGAEYQASLTVFALVAALASLRFLSVWPALLAFGAGRTGVVLTGTVAKLVSLPTAMSAGVIWGTVEAVVLGYFVGEAIGLTIFTALASRVAETPRRTDASRLLAFFLVSGTVATAAFCVEQQLWAFAVLTVAGGVVPAVTFIVVREREMLLATAARALSSAGRVRRAWRRQGAS